MVGLQPSAPDSFDIIIKKRAKGFCEAIIFLISDS